MNALLSRVSVRITCALVVVVLAWVVSRNVFREPQQLCMATATPGTVLTVRGTAVTSTYVPVEFVVPTGTLNVTLDTADGNHFDGTLTVSDSHSPEYSFGGATADRTYIDFCNAVAKGEVYATEVDGVITVYRQNAHGRIPTGFTLTRVERDGVPASANVIPSPDGVYIAYITWDSAANAATLSIAEAGGKNTRVLASLTPEQGEMALEDLAWSDGESFLYAEVTPMHDGPDALGNTRTKTLYLVDARTHAREAIRVVAMP